MWEMTKVECHSASWMVAKTDRSSASWILQEGNMRVSWKEEANKTALGVSTSASSKHMQWRGWSHDVFFILHSRSVPSLWNPTQNDWAFPAYPLNARAICKTFIPHANHLAAVISSAPFRTTPTTAPVCTTSPPPPLKRYSTSASPSNHVIITGAGTSSFVNSSLSAVMISANARPWFAFRELIICRQVVTSGVFRRVLRILEMSSGCGEAMHS